jgi:hypothetical protein
MDTKMVILKNERMTPRMVRLIAEIDVFKGYWKGMVTLSPNFLSNLRILATNNPSDPQPGLKVANSAIRKFWHLLKESVCALLEAVMNRRLPDTPKHCSLYRNLMMKSF